MATVDLEIQINLKKINDENSLCHVQWCMTVMNTGLAQDLYKQLYAMASIIQVWTTNKRNAAILWHTHRDSLNTCMKTDMQFMICWFW